MSAVALALFIAGAVPSSGAVIAAPPGYLPAFHSQLLARAKHDLSWTSGSHKPFARWRKRARQTFIESLHDAPPAAPFEPRVLRTEQRDGYRMIELELNLTADSRVKAFLTLPDRPPKQRRPAVLLLHDHGGRFDIGKEKVIRPAGARLKSATECVNAYYGGRWLGDELAKRGYVTFATDVINWGDRGPGHVMHQPAIASALMHMGMTYAGLIAHEDLRALEYLRSRDDVDPKQVAAMGLSLGAFRSWQLAALTDDVAATVSVGWMTTLAGVMQPGNNQTVGLDTWTVLHPGLLHRLDYPDLASISCPKPMLIYNGAKDWLFPIASVRAAHDTIRRVYSSQKADAKLELRIWPEPHLFSAAMQDAAFGWLERQLR